MLQWLGRMWQREPQPSLLGAYQAVFDSPHGQLLLQHWLDQVYCTIYEGQSAEQLWLHEGRRSFVQEILQNLDAARSPDKYRVAEEP
jgi:hypothetical protein